MKKLVILSAFLFTLLSCKQNAQNDIKEINITIKVDEGIVLKDESGKPLSDDVAFNEDEVVYAVPKQVENKARINTTEDERASISGDAFIELDILVPKTFKDVEAKIKEKLSIKSEWNNGDYDFF